MMVAEMTEEMREAGWRQQIYDVFMGLMCKRSSIVIATVSTIRREQMKV